MERASPCGVVAAPGIILGGRETPGSRHSALWQGGRRGGSFLPGPTASANFFFSKSLGVPCPAAALPWPSCGTRGRPSPATLFQMAELGWAAPMKSPQPLVPGATGGDNAGTWSPSVLLGKVQDEENKTFATHNSSTPLQVGQEAARRRAGTRERQGLSGFAHQGISW